MRAWCASVACAVALCAAPVAAWAQSSEPNDGTVPLTGTTLALASVAAGVPLVVTTTAGGVGSEEQLDAFLEANRFALALDVSVGAGEALSGLARIVGVEDVRALGKRMRARGVRWRSLLCARDFALDEVKVELMLDVVGFVDGRGGRG